MKKALRFICVVMLALMPASYAVGESTDSTVIRYYLKQARNSFETTYIFGLKRDFQCQAQAIATLTNYRGKLDQVDTLAYEVVYSDGKTSSINMTDTARMSENVIPEMAIPDMPWELDCWFYFFPNDTGGENISIGFEPHDATAPNAASGFIKLDRYNFTVKEYTIYESNGQFSERYSRVYTFEYRNLLTVPVALERHWRAGGFWGRRYFYQKITFDNYQMAE